MPGFSTPDCSQKPLPSAPPAFYTYHFDEFLQRRTPCRGSCCCSFSLFSAPSLSRRHPPGVTNGATRQQQKQRQRTRCGTEKSGYGALADVLDNDTSRQELIDQLSKGGRHAAARPGSLLLRRRRKPKKKNGTGKRHPDKPDMANSSVITLSQLWRNAPAAPHISLLNPHTFSSAACSLLFWLALRPHFYWLLRLSVWPLYRGKWASGDGKNESAVKAAGCIFRTIAGAFIIDLLAAGANPVCRSAAGDRLNAE